MISRIVSCNVKPQNVQEFRNALNRDLIPQLTRQPGFVDLIESIDTTSGQFVCTTLWKTKEDVERYDRGLFQAVADKLTPFLQNQPEVQTLTVENSTIHEISAGKQAAA